MSRKVPSPPPPPCGAKDRLGFYTCHDGVIWDWLGADLGWQRQGFLPEPKSEPEPKPEAEQPKPEVLTGVGPRLVPVDPEGLPEGAIAPRIDSDSHLAALASGLRLFVWAHERPRT